MWAFIVTTIEQILSTYGLGARLDVSKAQTNPWFVPFEHHGMDLCAYVGNPTNAQFCFFESYSIQAVAIQIPEHVVAMSAGMFSMLCRLSATITTKGIMPGMGSTAAPEWKPDYERWFVPIRDLLGTTPFDWPMESTGWAEDRERTALFFYLLMTMFRFVVLHELAHIAYDHQRRRTLWTTQRAAISVEAIGQNILPPDEAIRSQSRESVADAFAFMRLVEITDRELEQKKTDPVAQIVRMHLAKDNQALLAFILTALYLYFRMSDREDWRSFPLEALSHPPAPFRMKLICAALIEHRYLGIGEEQALDAVKEAVLRGDAIMSVTLNRYPEPNWIKLIESKEYDDHFYRLYEEFPNWTGPLSETNAS
jgi:hypothetical protein